MEEKRGEVAWNIVAEQTKFIGELLRKGTDNYLKGNIGGWFNLLTAVRENIDYDLKPNEKTSLNEIEKRCWLYQSHWNKYIHHIKDGKEIHEELKNGKKNYVAEVRKYSRELMTILNRLGYFPKKEDRTKLAF
jgi:hypothetical protein